MLKNENLKQISGAVTQLTVIKQYLLETNPTDFIDNTGIDLIDIQHTIKNLTHIHTTETMKHLQASEKSNAWNKAHPEQHRKHNRESGQRHKDKRKAYNKEYYLKQKALKGGK